MLATALVAVVVAAVTSLGTVMATGSSITGGDEPRGVGMSDVEPTSTSQVDGDDGAMSVAEVAATAAPSVAAVEVRVGSGANAPGGGVGRGSAVIIDSDGMLVTNAHVVANASEVSVTLADGRRHDAQIVGVDEATDLALLSVEATGLPDATLADEPPEIGTTAIAIGSPFGLDGSVSSGIVSALDRTLRGPSAALTGLIQTDAAINPGNSGGALLDDRAQVIGINTAILSGSGANDGVGFAVPSTVVADITDQLAASGSVERAVLGVSGHDVDPRVAEAYGLQVESGALIASVAPGSAAARAGLEPGDIITAVDGEAITGMSELAAAVQRREPGDTIELERQRGEDSSTVTAELD